MSPKIRALILIISVSIFLAISPLLILYGYGYRYDFRYRRFVKTGSLFITSIPSNASVLINDQKKESFWYEKLLIYKRLPWVIKLSGQTPVNLTGLLPGRYKLTLQKNNYQNWEREIEIFPEKTTVLQNIKLFLKSPETERSKTIDQVKNFWLAPSKTKIIYQTENQNTLNYLNLINDQIKPIYIEENQISQIDWSPDENFIILKTDKDQKIINLETLKIIFPENRLKNFSLIKWANDRSNFFYGQKYSLIYQILLNEGKIRPLFNFIKFSKQIPKKWLVKNNGIYWLIDNNNNTSLYYSLLKDNYEEPLNIIIKDRNLDFCSSQIKDLICLKGEKFLWLIENQTKKLEIIFQYPLTNFLFWQDNSFIGNNDYEIITGKILKNLNQENKIEFEVILRTSQKISKAIYYPSGDWVIFSQNDSLFGLELNGKKEIKNLIKTSNIFDFWSNQIGSIWLINKFNNSLKISKLRIQ